MEADDMKAMREALEAILKEANTQYRNDNGIDLEWLMAKAKAALSAPPRNCDVGTPEEQSERWEKFCSEHHKKWIGGKIPTGPCDCPCYEGNSCNSFLWAQMPYEEGGAK